MSIPIQKSSSSPLELNQSSELTLLDLDSSPNLNLNLIDPNVSGSLVGSSDDSKQQSNDNNEKFNESRIIDDHCWLCHKDKSNVTCKLCPRSFHLKCLPEEYIYSGQQEGCEKEMHIRSSGWTCIECTTIMKSEDLKTRSATLSQLSPQEFSQLLTYALQTIKAVCLFNIIVIKILFTNFFYSLLM